MEVVCKAPVASEHALNYKCRASEDQRLELGSNPGEFATQTALYCLRRVKHGRDKGKIAQKAIGNKTGIDEVDLYIKHTSDTTARSRLELLT